MPRDGAITVGDLVGRLEYLTLECEKCGRRGRYRVARLVEQHGPDHKLTDWQWQLTADCPRRQAARMSDWCGAGSPDLVRLFFPDTPSPGRDEG